MRAVALAILLLTAPVAFTPTATALNAKCLIEEFPPSLGECTKDPCEHIECPQAARADALA